MSGAERNGEAELKTLQERSFSYFRHETSLTNGLVKDKNAPDWPASVAATGLALTAYPVAVERGLISYSRALERTLMVLRFLWTSPQGPEPDATGYKGFFYHFLDMKTGRRTWQCELSTVDSAFLLAGALAAASYFKAETPDETEVRTLADALYRRVDWVWALDNGQTLTHGWRPESGFIPYRWEGYNEALLLYILALGSPTHPIPDSSYAAWLSTYQWESRYGYDYVYAGPMFTHQLSHCWIDFRGIQDAYMHEKGIDYFENSRRATYVQQRYAIENPLGFAGYDACCWGITASDGPGSTTLKINGVQRQFMGYSERGVPYGPDDGTVSPWAIATSLPFAPDIVLPAIDYCINHLELTHRNRYGFRASYNPTFSEGAGKQPTLGNDLALGWVSPWHFGINQGPIVLMIENYRTGLIWELMRQCPHVVQGLRRAGFSGGWLLSSS